MKQVQTRILTTVPEYEVEYIESYRPRIKADQMRRLRQIKEETGRPITQLIEEAVEQYLADRGNILDEKDCSSCHRGSL